jgi:hypothetical protein
VDRHLPSDSGYGHRDCWHTAETPLLLHAKEFAALVEHALLDDLIGPLEQRLRDREPKSLAVLRLMTSSNLVGCSTGRSPGLAPLRILSTPATAGSRQTGLPASHDPLRMARLQDAALGDDARRVSRGPASLFLERADFARAPPDRAAHRVRTGD